MTALKLLIVMGAALLAGAIVLGITGGVFGLASQSQEETPMSEDTVAYESSPSLKISEPPRTFVWRMFDTDVLRLDRDEETLQVFDPFTGEELTDEMTRTERVLVLIVAMAASQ